MARELGRMGLEEREKCNTELEEGSGTDLMKSLKNNWIGGVGQEQEILYLKKKLHLKLELIVQ